MMSIWIDSTPFSGALYGVSRNPHRRDLHVPGTKTITRADGQPNRFAVSATAAKCHLAVLQQHHIVVCIHFKPEIVPFLVAVKCARTRFDTGHVLAEQGDGLVVAFITEITARNVRQEYGLSYNEDPQSPAVYYSEAHCEDKFIRGYLCT